MNRTPPNRASHTARPLWGWGLALFSALLLSPGAATALLHCWAQQGAVLHAANPHIAQPRRDDTETLSAVAETAPDPAPRDEPAEVGVALPEPPAALRPITSAIPTVALAASHAPLRRVALFATGPRAPPAL